MESFLAWLADQAVALTALILAVVALVRTFMLGAKDKKGQNPFWSRMFSRRKRTLTPRLSYFEVEDNTHAIRGHKLVNHLALHFRNIGGVLYYENIVFSRANNHLEVEILAEKELEIFHDPRDDQRLETGECLRITFEREIGDPMDYDFDIMFSDENANMLKQHIAGKKGQVPLVGEPELAV